MPNLTSALFRIDPTEGLVEYVQAIKPYHTKVLDILVEYVYSESINVTVLDRWKTQVGMVGDNVDLKYHDPTAVPPYDLLTSKANADVIYACGFGHRWSEYGTTAPESSVTATIIRAISSPCPDDLTSQQDNNQIQGTVCHANSFVVAGVESKAFDAVAVNKLTNEFAFVKRHSITAVDYFNKIWVVAGNITVGSNPIVAGGRIYINANAGTGVNKPYTVVEAIFNGLTTNVKVAESISLLATVSGTLNVPLELDNMPYWDAGMQIKLQSTGTLPGGVVASGTYYFVPAAEPGVFTISRMRYPQHHTQFVDLTDLGTGELTITRMEPFIPGQTIQVRNTNNNRNDGNYVIGAVTPLGSNYVLTVIQRIPVDTPPGMTTDGSITLSVFGYDEPVYCAVASAPAMHADTFIHEMLQFSFDLDIREFVDASVEENQAQGFGVMPWGEGTYTAPFGAYIKDTLALSAATSVSESVLPHGFDVGLFDMGGMDEGFDGAA